LVEHVGSTSVPGCAGKGIVDLLLVYRDGQLADARDLLDALGFQRQTGRDPFPEERPMRVGSLVHGETAFNLHVHVIAASSPEAQELRGFRDRLRADAALVAAYVAAKSARHERSIKASPSDRLSGLRHHAIFTPSMRAVTWTRTVSANLCPHTLCLPHR
jgi:GrpB-like predicted nucleotidyltransferase (UPF0157 family)